MFRVLLIAFVLFTAAGCDSGRPLLVNGEPVPDFELPQLDGERVALSALRGEVVAVRFWADWCPYCRKEMAELEPVYLRLRSQGVHILAVNVSQDEARVRRFAERVGYSYPNLLDSDSSVANAYGVIAIPITYFVDREGILRGRIIGESDAAMFERMVEPLL